MTIREAENILVKQKKLYIANISKNNGCGDWGRYIIKNAKIKNEEFEIGLEIYENDLFSIFVPYNKNLKDIFFQTIAEINYIYYEYVDRIIEIGYK